jgi:hypothetical protein
VCGRRRTSLPLHKEEEEITDGKYEDETEVGERANHFAQVLQSCGVGGADKS